MPLDFCVGCFWQDTSEAFTEGSGQTWSRAAKSWAFFIFMFEVYTRGEGLKNTAGMFFSWVINNLELP